MTAVGILHIRLGLPAETLKEKRTIVKSVVERLRTRYNASVAEVDDLDTSAHATLAAVVVSNEAGHADSQLQAIARAIEEWRLDVVVEGITTEVLHV